MIILPKLNFLFYFERWYDGRSANVKIDDMENQTYTVLISEAP